MSENNSLDNNKNGRYALGGNTEFSEFAINWWNRNTMEQDPSDIVYFLEKEYEGEPRKLGIIFYGDPRLWWIICQYNGIIDPITELVEGKLLLIPKFSRVKSQLFSNQKTSSIKK